LWATTKPLNGERHAMAPDKTDAELTELYCKQDDDERGVCE